MLKKTPLFQVFDIKSTIFRTKKRKTKKKKSLITASLRSHLFITRNMSSTKNTKKQTKNLIAASVLSDPHTPETQH